ncbi:hypothetical protein HYW99_02610 [Candidatus Woesearchaeota archaeon]|nr:hypothetical protein [Candidatus Woesearchaeota archaeon]
MDRTPNLERLEQLKEIHRREYPIPQKELRILVEQAMQELSIAAKRVKRIKGDLSPQEQAYADSFLFYCDELKKRNVSPISVTINFWTENERVVLQRYYITDISFSSGGIGWHGLERPYKSIPRLEWNNLWSYFSSYRYIQPKEIEEYIKERLIEEHSDIFSEKFHKQELLSGDLHFGFSRFKQYLRYVDEKLRQGDIKTRPSEQEIARAKVELADRNLLAYIDLQGNEVRPGKTQFEAWQEFQKENPEHFKRLVEICNLPYEQRKPLHNELYPLVDKAFTLLRVKGFSKYPDLSA